MKFGTRLTFSGALFVVSFLPTMCSALLASKRDALLPPFLRTKETDLSSLKVRGRSSTFLNIQSGASPEEDFSPRPKPRPTIEPPPVTETALERQIIPPKSLPPKIVVLGATGRIGRRVIRQLMSLESDITIVAFVRDYERACEVLYDELLIERTQHGPQLQLVVMDLVPASFVAGYNPEKKDEEDDDDEEEFAVSASRFYDNEISDYDFRASKEEDALDLNPYLPLEDAIKNATAVISTIGTIRSTLPFSDYLLKPWRLFLSPGIWCEDKSHPYYVNYLVHEKILGYCETAQKQRNREMRVWQNNEKRRASKHSQDKVQKKDKGEQKIEKLRIVRISDHCLANPAWDVVNVITNIFRSLVFRYQEKCEKLLSGSNLVESIIIRPGDLVDDIRNETKTTMSVNIDGKLPGPVSVGRDDVASLAMLAAISDLEPKVKRRQAQALNGTAVPTGVRRSVRRSKQGMGNTDIKHWNIAVGWTGQKQNGYENAELCMEHIVKEQGKRTKTERRKMAVRNASPISRNLAQPYRRLMQRICQRTLKPWSFFVFLPMLLLVYPTVILTMISVVAKVPVLKNAAMYLMSSIEPMRTSTVEKVLKR